MKFKPLEASKKVVEKYKRYLSTIFEISDETYSEQFRKELNAQGNFAAGPYLDVTDSFVKGRSVSEMGESNDLAKSFLKLKMPLERPLYKHQ